MHYNGPSVCKTIAKSIRKAKVSSTAKRAAEVTSAYDGAIVVQAKSKKTPHPTKDDDDVNTTESTDVSDAENAATAVIFINLFTIHCTQNGVDPTLKTIMDNGAASNELFQLLQPTNNESVKNNDKIECETLKKLIHHNFRSDFAITSYNNIINPVYLFHGTHEVQLEYLRSILDSNI
ncbi:hypothetical protein ACTFIW_003840 [Dictyostelium discoideum]